MGTGRVREAGSRAEAFLRRALAACARERIAALPPVRTLARQAGVAVNTMCAAVHRLRTEGLLAVVPGGGVFAAGTAPARPVSDGTAAVASGERPLPRDERLVQQFIKDMLNGAYGDDGALPPLKALGVRYGASYPVLRRGLQRLLAGEHIERYGRGFRVRSRSADRPGSFVLLVSGSSAPATFFQAFDRTPEMVRSLERECSVRGLGLRVLGLYDQGAPPVAQRVREMLARHAGALYGTVVLNMGFDQKTLSELFAVLPPGRPAAFCEQSVLAPYASPAGPGAPARRYAVGLNAEAGADVGRYLLARGYRSAVCIKLVRSDATVNRRMEGVSSAFAAAGMASAVRTLELERYESDDPIEQEARRAQPFRALLAQAARLEQRLPDGAAGSGGWPVSGPIELAARLHYASRLLEPLFEQALALDRVTAWVLYNDIEAIAALNYLRRRRVAVPGRVAVIGFDNTIEALAAGLTSYDFNVPALVRTMLEFLARPDPGACRADFAHTVPLSVQGLVVRRESA